MRMIGLFRLAGIWCLLLVMSAAAREFTPEFRHLDKSAGMSASTVWAVAQDHDGFMWLATNDGLMRFDGRDFQVFRHQPGDPNSMPGNTPQNVMVDSQNTVWAAIEDHGLVWLDARQRQINNLRHDSNSENVLLGPDVFAFEEDQQQRLWLGFYGKGLQLLDLKTKKLEAVPLALSNATVLSIAVENDDAIWVGTMAGLDRVYRDQGQWFVQNALRGPMVVGVMRAIDGSFIAASDEGAYRSSLTPTGVKTEWFDMHLAGSKFYKPRRPRRMPFGRQRCLVCRGGSGMGNCGNFFKAKAPCKTVCQAMS